MTAQDAEMPDEKTLESMLEVMIGARIRLAHLKAALSCPAYKSWLEKLKEDLLEKAYECGCGKCAYCLEKTP